MDQSKVWMLLQIARELVGFPQYVNIRNEAMRSLAEIDAKLVTPTPTPAPKAIPSTPAPERKI